MAAGNSDNEATAQALSEIIERYVKNIIIQNGYSLPDLPATTMDGFSQVQQILRGLSDYGYIVRVKDASLGGNFPVILVLLINIEEGGVYASFGANLRLETAVERTLTELLQGRNLNQLLNFLPPSNSMAEVSDQFNLESHFINSDGLLSWRMFREKTDYPYNFWDFEGNTDQEVSQLEPFSREL